MASKVTVNTDTINLILVLGSIAGILLLALALVDFLINRWKYFKLAGGWFRKQWFRFNIDQPYVTLKIPAPTPTKPLRSPATKPVLAQLTDVTTYSGEELKRALDAAPHIDLIFDLPKTDDTRGLVRDEQLSVVNTSDTIAYDVSIQPRETHSYKAEFETIARLEKGHPVFAVMDLRAKPGGAYHKEFEMLLKLELEHSSEDDNFNVRVPIVVRFYDAKKKFLYQTSHEVIYNAFWHEAHVHLIRGTTPIKLTPPLPDASALVNTPPGPNKRLVKRIMRGPDKLMAWEILRGEFPRGYFVEFAVRNLEPKSGISLDYRVANEQWHEWYKEWKQQPGGFGGASGDGLFGELPW
jgi:hypothetical protein